MKRTISLLLLLFLAGFSTAAFAQTKKPAKTNTNQKSKPTAQTTPWDSAQAEQSYQIIRAELKLAATEKAYLVINLKKMELELRLKAVPVWSYPLKSENNDTSSIRDFGESFFDDGNGVVRTLEDKHLFAGKKQTPDSILKIVSEASKVSPELLQRIVPARFQLTWEGGFVLDCVTDVSAQPESSLKNTLVELGQMLKIPFGLKRLEVKIAPDAAITLFRASEPGLPTLINP